MAKRFISLKRQRALAARMTLATLAMQGALLVTLAVTPGDPPGGATLWKLLWASSRKPTFVPLVILLLAGPPLTWLAWRIGGPHRRWLVAGWLTFAVIVALFYIPRLDAMLRILWWRYAG